MINLLNSQEVWLWAGAGLQLREVGGKCDKAAERSQRGDEEVQAPVRRAGCASGATAC